MSEIAKYAGLAVAFLVFFLILQSVIVWVVVVVIAIFKLSSLTGHVLYFVVSGIPAAVFALSVFADHHNQKNLHHAEWLHKKNKGQIRALGSYIAEAAVILFVYYGVAFAVWLFDARNSLNSIES